MPKGSLELDKKYITPKRDVRSPEAYSAASVVKDLSPVKNVQEAAKVQSMQEKFDKDLLVASRGGKTRHRKSKKSKKTKRRHIK